MKRNRPRSRRERLIITGQVVLFGLVFAAFVVATILWFDPPPSLSRWGPRHTP